MKKRKYIILILLLFFIGYCIGLYDGKDTKFSSETKVDKLLKNLKNIKGD